ncbi:MAG TPA: hypothetical protein DG761_05225 [Gammaproteobacteria bacterium]|nr:hypothetical protein [Gammaproteobacteria bacterium]
MYPIIALWAHPRSLSTVFERIMRERGDLNCLHEPFMYDYYVHRRVRIMPGFEIDLDHPAAYREIRDSIVALAQTGPVFFKDMSYYVLPYLPTDPDFASKITHSFLIRNPVSAIVSYYRLDSKITLEEIGIASQWTHFKALVDLFGTEPIVIEAESVQARPKQTLSHYWEQVKLDYVDHAFNWSQEDAPAAWQPVKGWHQGALASQGIRDADPDEAARKREAYAQCLVDAPHLADYLAHHMPAYEELKSRAQP